MKSFLKIIFTSLTLLSGPVRHLLLIILLAGGVDIFAQTKDASDNIIIYGDSFLFSIHQPIGWQGDVENAKNYNANIIFYKNKEDFKKGGTTIQILTYKKVDEEVNKDLEQDIIAIKEKNHDLKQQNISANNKTYACFSKLAYVENTFYHYIAYINPGSQFRNAFSISMKIPKHAATKEELSAFRDVISTLVVFKR